MPALEGKLAPDPSLQGSTRVEGSVEPSGSGWTFTGEAFDLGTLVQRVHDVSGAFGGPIVRDRVHLGHVTWHADYLNPAPVEGEAAHPNQVDKSIQTTRRFDALTLRTMGSDGIGELFDEVVDRAADTWSLLSADRRFEVVTKPQLSTLVFRYEPPPGTSAAVRDAANLSWSQLRLNLGAVLEFGSGSDTRRLHPAILRVPEGRRPQ